MLFFQLDFLLLFLAPLMASVAILKAFGARALLPWIASIASLIFLFAYSEISVAIALLSISINYFAARQLLARNTATIFAGAVAANLVVLAYFKYSGWFAGSLPWAWHFLLPLGISFYTFQQIAFLADVYRGKVSSFSFRTYILFKLFFPQFIAGPITHFERVRASYERWPTFNTRSIRYGLTIFSIGMAKKLIGDHFGEIASPIFASPSTLTFYSAWLGMLAFTFQIYFDFAGYSDMAVGLARLFGVSLPFNFNSPYKAKSIGEFWRRWHMTLSQWLRDYLYIPLGGNRHGALRTALALFLTMALGGLWHGAGWTYVLWGVAHGVALILVRFAGFRVPAVLGTASTFIFVILAWVLFRSATLDAAIGHYAALIDPSLDGVGIELQRVIGILLPSFEPSGVNLPEQISRVAAILLAGLLCFSAPNSQHIALWFAARRVRAAPLIELPVLAALVLILSIAFNSPDTTSAFIYFQF
jgi:alginate O-acetyltransferase complex protein AlgI